MEENKDEMFNQEILTEPNTTNQQGGQASYTQYFLTDDSRVQLSSGGDMPISQIIGKANLFLTKIGSALNNNPSFDLPGAAAGTPRINNRILLLSDLLGVKDATGNYKGGLLDPTSDIYKVFSAVPIAQYKHLPDPAALNPVNFAPAPATGGGNSEVVAEEEQLPSMEVQDESQSNMTTPIQGGVRKSNRWSSHKKRKSARYSTKKNRKL